VAGELILIVEDNEKNLKLAKDVLQFRGYRTLEAENARDAIALAISHLPDLILMEIQLPEMDGVTELNRLKAEPATAGIHVVALTALAMPRDRERLLGAGFAGYLSKPIDVKQFGEQVRSYCELAGLEG